MATILEGEPTTSERHLMVPGATGGILCPLAARVEGFRDHG